MKAYIDIRCVPHGTNGKQTQFVGELVSEQDYEGGPWAHSFRSQQFNDKKQAFQAAQEEAKKQKLTLVDGPDQF